MISSELSSQLVALRPKLLGFARLQLRDEAAAEDAVSETLIAVLERPDSFQGRSELQTWLIGILKHKIIDRLRTARRECLIEPREDQTQDEALEALFDANGHFIDPPRPWPQPDERLEQRQFFEVLQQCVDKLPPSLARIFMMREWLELETDVICAELAIGTSNCWVMLYRARMRLRECLQLHWFDETSA